MSGCYRKRPSPPFRGEREETRREAVGRVRWAYRDLSGIPHLTPTLSAPHGTKAGGEGVERR